jgi:F420-non-reducing hydrogenase iron-sulfur subunit
MPESVEDREAKPFEPRIVAFFCNWCTYTAADLAGTARMVHAPNARIVRIMCSGRLDPQFVLAAFRGGADGVLIGGCHPGDCHYQEGNYKALRRVTLLRTMLRLEWISASEGDRVQRVMNEMAATVKRLGPLRMSDMPPARRREPAQRHEPARRPEEVPA